MFYNGLAHTQFSKQSLSGSPKRKDGGSKRLEPAVHNFYFGPIELSHNEAIESLIVGATIVSQEPQGLLFADEKAADAVGTITSTRMHYDGLGVQEVKPRDGDRRVVSTYTADLVIPATRKPSATPISNNITSIKVSGLKVVVCERHHKSASAA